MSTTHNNIPEDCLPRIKEYPDRKEMAEHGIQFSLGSHFPYKGLFMSYFLDCMYDEEIQAKWRPREGDIMVGCTGNIWVVSNQYNYSPKIGGTKWYFGGYSCNRDGGCFMDSTASYTMNESGVLYGLNGPLENPGVRGHSTYRDFRYVPYPHELSKEKRDRYYYNNQ